MACVRAEDTGTVYPWRGDLKIPAPSLTDRRLRTAGKTATRAPLAPAPDFLSRVYARAERYRQTAGFVDRMVFEPERQPTVGPARSHWGRLEDAGLAPRRILLGPRRIAWRLSDLLAWIDERAAVVDTPEARRRRAPQMPSAAAPEERTTPAKAGR